MTSNKETMLKKFGTQEAYLEHMRNIAAKGGARKVSKGFAKLSLLKRRSIAAKGGRVTRTKENI